MSIREDLKAFVDGELSSARAEEVRLAVEQDPALQQEVQYMKLLTEAIKEEAPEPEVLGAERALHAVSRKRMFSIPRPLLIGLAGLAVLALGVVFFPVFGQSKYAAKMESENAAAYGTRLNGKLSNGTPADVPGTGTAAAGGAGFPAGGAPPQAAAKGIAGEFRGGTHFRLDQAPSNGEATANVPATVSEAQPQSNNKIQYTPPTPPMSARSSRMIVQNGDVAVAVDDVSKRSAEARKLTEGAGGFVQNSSLDYDQENKPVATLTLRIPANRFISVLNSVLALGTVKSNHTTGEDVTAQYADVDGRLKVLGAEEDSYVTMLRAAKSVGQLLEIKDRLSSVRQEIASLQSQKSALKDQSALSTLNLTLEEKPKAGKSTVPQSDNSEDTWAQDAWATAVNGMTSALKFLSKVAIFLFVYAPIWLPVALIGWWLNRRTRKA